MRLREQGADYRAGLLAATFVNLHLPKDHTPLVPSDFFPDLARAGGDGKSRGLSVPPSGPVQRPTNEREQRQHVEAMEAKLHGLQKLFGSSAIRARPRTEGDPLPARMKVVADG